MHCGRLSAEKKPQRSLTTLATLRASGLPVRLVVAGDGPLRPRLERRAARAGLPVTFTGFLPGRADLAALLASADVVLAPGPAETFGLAALEALACGTPVVVSAESALPEVAGEAGASVPGEDLAAGVRAVLARPERARRAAARARAEQFDWATAVRGFLAVHEDKVEVGEAGMTTFVALGDSITVGMGDPAPAAGAAGPRCWPARCPSPRCTTWPGWARWPPTWSAFSCRPRWPCGRTWPAWWWASTTRCAATSIPERTGASVGRTVAALRAAGAQVLTMRLPDPGQMFGLPGALARPLARRMRAVNAAVDEVARRHGTVHLDAARDPATYERRYWSVDRLHPNERGHRLIACRFHALLAASGYPVGPGPDPEPSSPPPTRLAEARWMATKGTAWLIRRSRDLVPALVGLAVREWLAGESAPEEAAPGTNP